EHPCPLGIIKQTKKPVTVEHIHYDSHGSPRHVEVHGHPILDDEGRVSRMIEYTLDITKRKQIEEERNQLIKSLQDSLAKIKTLSGMLPICASCKKIRDDKGYWNQIETYLHRHSEAEFSHGICPECAKKLYPDII
ncbi:MAG: PAS domain-containing protein, partial [Desulfobacterales bacterium]